MKRMVNFRGKRLDTQEWVYGSLTQNEGQCCIYKSFGAMCATSYMVEPKSVGQKTGVGGKEQAIYEHDILRHKRNGKLFVVVWNGAHAGFELKCKENNYESMLFANASYGNYEIIGNKIDNPDLWYGGSEHDTED